LHVPLFVKYPQNARGGTRVSHWVQSIDLMPSILRHIGLPVPEGVQGGSLDDGTALIFAEESHEGNVLHSVRELRDFEERKLITANAGNPRGLEPVELYDTMRDPGEQQNVAEAERERVRELMSTLEEARRRAAEGAVESGEQRELDDETRRQLCAIGYLDTGECCRDGFLTGDPCRDT
ncbi:MAG TPA: sulfatase/phosphatase domain-containing protein, partial [Sandaracinaceae bacterium]